MNVERIVKEIRAVFESEVRLQEINYYVDDRLQKVLEIFIEADAVKKEEFEKLNNVLFEYDLKIIEFGVNCYEDSLYIYLIEK